MSPEVMQWTAPLPNHALYGHFRRVSRKPHSRPHDAARPPEDPGAIPGRERASGLPKGLAGHPGGKGRVAGHGDSQAWLCYFLPAQEGQMRICLRRREFIAGLGGAATWPIAARGQQGDRVRRIGVLMPFDENDPEGKLRYSAFAQALANLGWTDGRNVHMDLSLGRR